MISCWCCIPLCCRQELQLRFTLPTGQSFRWRRTSDDTYTGVVQGRVVALRQRGDDLSYKVLGWAANIDPATDTQAITDYLNLGVQLSAHQTQWAAADKRFAALAPYIQGARVLRQPPLECLFSFVCSSNNHISRIAGMVERLCTRYGSPIEVVDDQSVFGKGAEEKGSSSSPSGSNASTSDGVSASYYAFPTLQQLEAATEEELYAEGFGYRYALVYVCLVRVPQPACPSFHNNSNALCISCTNDLLCPPATRCFVPNKQTNK